MKIRAVITILLLIFAAETAGLLFFAAWDTEDLQDAVLVNEAFQSVQADWDDMEHHKNQTSLDYVVLDADGSVLFKTKAGLSESVNEAVIHKDTILDLPDNHAEGTTAGKILFYNEGSQILQSQKEAIIWFLSIAVFLQCAVCIGYLIYLNHTVAAPFEKLKQFSERVAGGNLDIPLEMDRQNLFGAFTESFDLMRSELKKARQAEAKVNASKKELVAKLSHDIKTPVASIKAAAEVGHALADSEKIRDNYTQIIRKADQINTLIENLFTASLEELTQLSVTPEDMESRELNTLLANSDYLRRAVLPSIPDCLLHADKLRLQQVFDNLFANAYKYAGTSIIISISRDDPFLAVTIEDRGGGISAEELPFIKEKFRRGKNAGNIEGAGLGLYISDYFMKEMQGNLTLKNGRDGLKATVNIPLSGSI